MKPINKNDEWYETILDIITDPEAQKWARDLLGLYTVDELRKLVRHFRPMQSNTGLTGLATAGLNKVACIDWLLGTPGVEFINPMSVFRPMIKSNPRQASEPTSERNP